MDAYRQGCRARGFGCEALGWFAPACLRRGRLRSCAGAVPRAAAFHPAFAGGLRWLPLRCSAVRGDVEESIPEGPATTSSTVAAKRCARAATGGERGLGGPGAGAPRPGWYPLLSRPRAGEVLLDAAAVIAADRDRHLGLTGRDHRRLPLEAAARVRLQRGACALHGVTAALHQRARSGDTAAAAAAHRQAKHQLLVCGEVRAAHAEDAGSVPLDVEAAAHDG